MIDFSGAEPLQKAFEGLPPPATYTEKVSVPNLDAGYAPRQMAEEIARPEELGSRPKVGAGLGRRTRENRGHNSRSRVRSLYERL